MPTRPDAAIAPNLVAVPGSGELVARALSPSHSPEYLAKLSDKDNPYSWTPEQGADDLPVADLGGVAVDVVDYETANDAFRSMYASATESYQEKQLANLSPQALVNRAVELGNLPAEDSEPMTNQAGKITGYKYRVGQYAETDTGAQKDRYIYVDLVPGKRLKDLATPRWHDRFPRTNETRSSNELAAAIREEEGKPVRDDTLIESLRVEQGRIRDWERFLKDAFRNDPAGQADLDGARKLVGIVRALDRMPGLRVEADKRARAQAKVTAEAEVFQLARRRLPALEREREQLRVHQMVSRSVFRRDLGTVRTVGKFNLDKFKNLGIGAIGSEDALGRVTARIDRLVNRLGAGIRSPEMVKAVAGRLKELRMQEDARAFAGGFIETESAMDLINKALPVLRKGGNVMLLGDTGGAKTALAKHLARYLDNGAPVLISCNESSDEAALMGSTGLRAVGDHGAMETGLDVKGALFAAKNGRVLILDEINALRAANAKVLNDILNLRPGQTVTFAGETFTVQEGFCVVATANTGSVNEATDRYAGVNVMSAELVNRFGHNVHRVPYPGVDQKPSYWKPGQPIDQQPIDLLRFAASFFTNEDGLFVPDVDPSLAGITTEEFMRLVYATHTTFVLFSKPIKEIEAHYPDLYEELTVQGLDDGFCRKELVDMADDETTALKRGVLSPRALGDILQDIRGGAAGDGKLNQVLETFVRGLGEEQDRYTMRKVLESFGFLEGTPQRTDFVMPDLYPNVEAEVNQAYEAAERRRVIEESEAEASSGDRKSLPKPDSFFSTAERKKVAEKQVNTGLTAWGQVSSSVPGLGLTVPSSFTEMLKAAATAGKEDAIGEQLNKLMEARDKLIYSGAKTVSGANVGELAHVVWVPVSAMLGWVRSGEFVDMVGKSKVLYGGDADRYLGAAQRMAQRSGSSNLMSIYRDPDDASGSMNMIQYLEHMEQAYGAWMPTLVVPPDDPIEVGTKAADAFNDGSGRYTINEVRVDGGGIAELVAATIQGKSTVDTQRLYLLANKLDLPDGTRQVATVTRNGRRQEISLVASSMANPNTSPFIAVV